MTSSCDTTLEPTIDFPMDSETWQEISKQLQLPPQQLLIVESILRGNGDKEIAEDLGISVPTVRTYLHRIFDRTGANNRINLILKIFAMAQEIVIRK